VSATAPTVAAPAAAIPVFRKARRFELFLTTLSIFFMVFLLFEIRVS
jgi:hypothetical protein